jgi:hypothetical protein
VKTRPIVLSSGVNAALFLALSLVAALPGCTPPPPATRFSGRVTAAECPIDGPGNITVANREIWIGGSWPGDPKAVWGEWTGSTTCEDAVGMFADVYVGASSMESLGFSLEGSRDYYVHLRPWGDGGRTP